MSPAKAFMSAFESYFLIDQNEILTSESGRLGNWFAIGYSGLSLEAPGSHTARTAQLYENGTKTPLGTRRNIAEMVPAMHILT